MGDSVTLDGVEYISSKRAAEESGYTKDYIGQLARAGKIDARMVGRSWYVRSDALHKHDTEIHSGDETTAIVTNRLTESTEAHEQKVLIKNEEEPIPRMDRPQAPLVRASAFTLGTAEKRERERRMGQNALLARANIYFTKHASYEAETSPLVPLIAKHIPTAPPTKASIHEIRVSHAEATRTKIQPTRSTTNTARRASHTNTETSREGYIAPIKTPTPGTKNLRYLFIPYALFFFTALLLLMGLASFFLERSVMIENANTGVGTRVMNTE